MPRPPAVSPAAAALPAVSYAIPRRAAEGRETDAEAYPLHLGDTWRTPPPGCRMEDLAAADHPGLYRYAPPQGLPALVDALLERLRAEAGVPVQRKNLLVTAGATGGFAAVLGALLSPGEELLLLAPHWPLAAGLARAFGAVPVQVPFHGEVRSADEAVARVAGRVTPRTAALYLSSPNNPTGEVLPCAWVEALVDWARREGLWILSDEVFRDFIYEEEEGDPSPTLPRFAGEGATAPVESNSAPRPEPPCAFALAPERAFSFRSFSKTYGMAGNRCGWVAGPLHPLGEALKMSTQLVYSAPTAAQRAALAALQGPGEAWIAEARRQYAETGRRVAARLGLPAPQGGTFLFLDVARELSTEDLAAFLRRCAARGLLLAPGPSFGPYPTHVRLCFSAAPPETVERGADLLAGMLGR